MTKTGKMWLSAIALFALAIVLPLNSVKALSSNDAYKAIVQVVTFYENDYFQLTAVSSGSGVIISSNGLVLTNHHVVDLTDSFDNELPVAFMVCLTETTTAEPRCHYSADLIAKDEDKDIALLRIRTTSVSSRSSFDFLQRVTTNSVHEGDAVKALGYPSAGGETITISDGTVTGLTEQYGVSWIKNSALTSFGSSGGALIDSSGNLLGITSSSSDDVGYAININSINSWIAANANISTVTSSLQSRMNNNIVRQKDLESTNTFSNALPAVEITKANGWEFNLMGESWIVISNPNNQNADNLMIKWLPSEMNVSPATDVIVKVIVDTSDCYKAGTATIGSKIGVKLICPSGDRDIYQVFLSSKNYAVLVAYGYGVDDVGKSEIDQMLASIKLSDEGNNFSERKSYIHSDPYFKVTLPANWALMPKNQSDAPLTGTRTDLPEAGMGVDIEKISVNMKDLSNEDFYNQIKDSETNKYNYEAIFGWDAEVMEKSYDFDMNSSVQNAIFVSYKFKDEDDGDKVKLFAAAYIIRQDERLITVGMVYYGDDQSRYDQARQDFEQNVLSKFSLDPNSEPEQNQPETPVVTPAQLQVKDILNLGKKQIGKILLQVEKHGEAWYLSPKTNKAYYLGRAESAFQVMREQGVGISNKDLEKIPVGLGNLSGDDTDKDGLTDMLEDALGTDKTKIDTDGDGKNDKQEIEQGYKPTQGNYARMPLSSYFGNTQKGKIVLQVESHGEAWYINPKDGKRYFLGRPQDAYNVMRYLGLGITEKDFEKI